MPGSGQSFAAAAADEARGLCADCWPLAMAQVKRRTASWKTRCFDIRRARLPEPVVHYNLFHGDEWLGEIDFAYPEARIAIEVHGYRVHSLKPVWENDQRRENNLVRAGWKLLKATNLQLDQHPHSFIETLRSLLRGKDKQSAARGSRAR